MNSIARHTPKLDSAMLAMGLVGLLVGIGLTLGFVLGTHHFERVRLVPALPDAAAASQQPAAANGTDAQAIQRRVDEANMIRHDPVGQSPASVLAAQLRVDQENMIRHDPPLPTAQP